MKHLVWEGCYDDGWGKEIVSQSYAHPAKYSRALINRIYDHLLAQGYIKKGDIVGDCFGGVGLGGIIAAYKGLRWVGVELEPRFVEWAKENFELHRYKLSILKRSMPHIKQGDSRKFNEIVAAIVTSPPYADTSPEKTGKGINLEKQWETYRKQGGGMGLEKFKAQQQRHAQGYGKSKGQISSLKSGSVSGVVTSWMSGKDLSRGKSKEYGKTNGQIGILKSGKLHAVVTSPPYEGLGGGVRSGRVNEAKWTTGSLNRKMGKSHNKEGYGQAEGNIGNEVSETYWSAMMQVYSSCFKSIQSGGVIVVVIKDYVRHSNRVRPCDDTLMLLKHVGFVPLERIRAMLVNRTSEDGLFGDRIVKTKERKSFFKRLHESRLSADSECRIDWEEVLILRKP